MLRSLITLHVEITNHVDQRVEITNHVDQRVEITNHVDQRVEITDCARYMLRSLTTVITNAELLPLELFTSLQRLPVAGPSRHITTPLSSQRPTSMFLCQLVFRNRSS